MTHKFKQTLSDKLSDINDEMVMAREAKRKEVEEKYIPDSIKKVLTPDEIRRASKGGLMVGYIAVLLIIVAFGIVALHWVGVI